MLSKTASTLALLTAVVHVLIGGEDALAPMLAAELATPAKGAMHACWHIVSVFLIWSVVVFWMADRTMLHFGLLWIASALVFMYVGLRQDGVYGLITNPQWTILGATGGIALLSLSRQTKPGRV